MTIIVFLIDNTASMAQKSYVGVSYLDFARQFVGDFLKARQRDITFMKADRYMLMGFDEYPRNVKSGWKENQGQFNEQLRNLRPTGRSQFAEALFNAIRFINLNRVQSGIENFGYGRYPSYMEPVVFIAVLDATSDSARKNFLQNNRFPKLPALGSELTEEPYRWDHKLFVVYVNLPSHPSQRLVQPVPFSNERKQIESVVDKMNGRAFDLSSHKSTPTVIDGILQRIQQSGVFVKFDRFGPAPNTSNDEDEVRAVDNWKSQVILINRLVIKDKSGASSQSSWPIPEAFWPDQLMATLPPRKVYPELIFRCDPAEPVSNTNIGFDTYELEPCPLTQALIAKKNPKECWQVFVADSHKSKGIGFPFGYLKANSSLQTVNFFVFPYNYPLLFAIIEEVKDPKIAKTPEFKQKLDRYFANVPPYYISPLRKALKNMSIPHQFLDERVQPPLPYSINLINQLKRWRDPGREELDSTCAHVATFINPANPDSTKVFNIICGVHQLPMVDVIRQVKLNRETSSKVGLLRNYQLLQPLFKDCKIAVSTTRYPKNPSSKFRNPYDIDRDDIVEQVEKMRVNLDLQFKSNSITVLEGGLPGQKLKLQHAEDLHSLPVTKMGDYQEYTKRLASIGMGPMREFEAQEAKPRAFGNPFRLDNKKSAGVDEVGEADAGTGTSSPTPGGTSNKKDEREEHLRKWERRLSVSRGNTPEPEDYEFEGPAPRRRRMESPINTGSETEMLDNPELFSPASNDIPSPIMNDIDIVNPQVLESKRLTEKSSKKPSSSKNGRDALISSGPETSQTEAMDTSDTTKKTVMKDRKRRAQPESSNSSSSGSSSEEKNEKPNGKSMTMFGDSEPLKNIDFKRRPYPSTPLTSAEDPPTLNKEAMIRLKFHLLRAIKHKDHKARYDPGKECIRLINDLSWREQFEILNYAYEKVNKPELAPLANVINGELKRIRKCIRINKVNGSSSYTKFF